MKIFSDKPITNNKDDILGRSRFADLVASFIISDESSDNLVVSINGTWGSGKTSIINLIKEKLRETSFVTDSQKIPMIVDYSPWNVTSQDKLVEHFLNVLRGSFATVKVLKFIRTTIKTAKKVVSLIPNHQSLKTIVKMIDNAFSEYANCLVGKADNLEDLKQKVSRSLSRSRLKYIVFIDDLDRLNNDEIKLLIQLVKSVCNFPNITYVLSFDKTIVSNALNNSQASVSGSKYLEKIVQMEFTVPSIKSTKMQEIVYGDVLKILGECSSDDIVNIKTYMSLGLFKQIQNLREEKRYINNLLFALEAYGKELDIADLCAITYLRCVDEKIFQLILEYRDCILEKPLLDDQTLKSAEKEFYEELEKTNFDFKHNKYFLSHIFPNMFNTSTLIPQKLNDIKRLYHINKFKLYLQMELEDSDISAERLSGVLSLERVDLLLTLASSLSEKQLDNLFKLIVDATYDLNEENKFRVILNFVFTYLPYVEHNLWDYEVQKEHRIRVIIRNMIDNVGISKTEKVLLDVVNDSNDYNSLVALFYLLTEKEPSSYRRFPSFSKDLEVATKNKAKESLLKFLDGEAKLFRCESRGLIKFIIDYCKEDLIEIIRKKEDAWISYFLSNFIYLGSRTSKSKTNYCYYFDKEFLNVLKDNFTFDFSKLIKSINEGKIIQRLISIKMQLEEVPYTGNEEAYYCKDIEDYCNKNNIDFKPSDSYEEKNILTLDS